ncbi:MAG: LLM class F420-dependent oxidoreductase [Acidimicrobiia bacterium]|nr:LLM class F420-dependent oxidoreductase [Acidimicrobiia bacterium]
MKVGVVPVNGGPFIEPGVLTSFAQLVESLGYESVWTFEHVIVPDQYSSVYPYNPSGKLAISGSDRFVDPLVALTWVAAATERLRLGTGVNILSQANPLYLAKWASSIDHLSGGRLMLGVGVGWLREEFEALGVPFERRGPRADEYIDAMSAAWRGETVEYRGEFVDWHGWSMQPTPTQRPGRSGDPRVPIVVGGTSPAAIRRLVARGDGWYVIHKDLDEFRTLMAAMRAECERQGRDPSELEITAYWNHHREGLDGARAYEEEGVHRLLVNTAALRMGKPFEAVQRFADEVLSQL